MFFMLSKVTQLVSGRARTETRIWLSTLSTPPLNWGYSAVLLFSLPHRVHQRTQHEKGHAFSFFYVLYLPPLHHRVPRKVLSKRACLEATLSSCCHRWGWDKKHGGAGRWIVLLWLLGDGEGLYCLCLDSKAFSIS